MKIYFNNISLFDICFRILLIALPFTTILSIWMKQKFGFGGFSFYKEILLIIMFFSLVFYHIRNHIKIRWSWIDTVILAYISSMMFVTFFTTGIPGIIYGGRYDFSFLIAFWILYHGSVLLSKNTSYYLKIFLISGGTMLFLSSLLKWPFSEDILLWFGYCGNPSNWQTCNGIPPIFHGIEGANIRRFQGLLDGPNTMGAFLIFFGGIFTYYMRVKREWYFIVGCILIGLFIMIVYTYGRGALLGAFGAIIIAIILRSKSLYRKYKIQFITMILIGGIVLSILGIKYADNAGAILGREGSTKGHYERMLTSIDRFIQKPMGQGLGSSGPAYRYILDVDPSNIEEKDHFYIPESWYIQQFVEGGIIGGILFLIIMLFLFISLVIKSSILGGMFAGIGIMNIFLHTFESSVLVLPLFMLIGLLLSETKNSHNL